MPTRQANPVLDLLGVFDGFPHINGKKRSAPDLGAGILNCGSSTKLLTSRGASSWRSDCRMRCIPVRSRAFRRPVATHGHEPERPQPWGDAGTVSA